MGNDASRATSVLIMEEQEIFHHAYKEIFKSTESFKVTQTQCDADYNVMQGKIAQIKPDVLVVSLKKCNHNSIEAVSKLTGEFSRLAVVLIAFVYTPETTPALREMVSRRQAGIALLLKQSIDRVDQMHNMVRSVIEGQLVIDPALTGMLFAEKKTHPFLAQLTKRETEILSLVSEGYTNSAIAKALYIDVRTVQHHIENMYAKMKSEDYINDRHPRVSASRLYLETTGKLVRSK
ncbi:MAG: response regulator transcription factor [Dehalococcoidales bacterium]|nr:response regulator transcription factor [Dehalococcoidales bacterium]